MNRNDDDNNCLFGIKEISITSGSAPSRNGKMSNYDPPSHKYDRQKNVSKNDINHVTTISSSLKIERLFAARHRDISIKSSSTTNRNIDNATINSGKVSSSSTITKSTTCTKTTKMTIVTTTSTTNGYISSNINARNSAQISQKATKKKIRNKVVKMNPHRTSKITSNNKQIQSYQQRRQQTFQSKRSAVSIPDDTNYPIYNDFEQSKTNCGAQMDTAGPQFNSSLSSQTFEDVKAQRLMKHQLQMQEDCANQHHDGHHHGLSNPLYKTYRNCRQQQKVSPHAQFAQSVSYSLQQRPKQQPRCQNYNHHRKTDEGEMRHAKYDRKQQCKQNQFSCEYGYHHHHQPTLLSQRLGSQEQHPKQKFLRRKKQNNVYRPPPSFNDKQRTNRTTTGIMDYEEEDSKSYFSAPVKRSKTRNLNNSSSSDTSTTTISSSKTNHTLCAPYTATTTTTTKQRRINTKNYHFQPNNTKRNKNSNNNQNYNDQEEMLMKKPSAWDRRMIKIAPGLVLPLHGGSETENALIENRVRTVTCLQCEKILLCIQNASLVVCPQCRSVSPTLCTLDNNVLTSGTSFERSTSQRQGVNKKYANTRPSLGLGIDLDAL